jgi:hypothetical protein
VEHEEYSKETDDHTEYEADGHDRTTDNEDTGNKEEQHAVQGEG